MISCRIWGPVLGPNKNLPYFVVCVEDIALGNQVIVEPLGFKKESSQYAQSFFGEVRLVNLQLIGLANHPLVACDGCPSGVPNLLVLGFAI
jgi:hypothetical protein